MRYALALLLLLVPSAASAATWTTIGTDSQFNVSPVEVILPVDYHGYAVGTHHIANRRLDLEEDSSISKIVNITGGAWLSVGGVCPPYTGTNGIFHVIISVGGSQIASTSVSWVTASNNATEFESGHPIAIFTEPVKVPFPTEGSSTEVTITVLQYSDQPELMAVPWVWWSTDIEGTETEEDCDENGIADVEELSPETDTNDNGILDVCEDCDENGVIDSEELSPETDADDNGILDVCEDGDCDDNGVPDADELNSETDADDNGILDVCEGPCDCICRLLKEIRDKMYEEPTTYEPPTDPDASYFTLTPPDVDTEWLGSVGSETEEYSFDFGTIGGHDITSSFNNKLQPLDGWFADEGYAFQTVRDILRAFLLITAVIVPGLKYINEKLWTM